ncbi:NADPH oxidase activator 1 [Puma concolor]|uniref:NADPH oxidase activator 1 n=1 Tax=Puma concolor TaxID=9696 RepID=A0A6P6HWC4_PUMCO|nr:NADPH oxidase activator 1 [Puma concolor]
MAQGPPQPRGGLMCGLAQTPTVKGRVQKLAQRPLAARSAFETTRRETGTGFGLRSPGDVPPGFRLNEHLKQAFDQAVTKDTCMAVGFFQRGVASFQLERFQEALCDFRLALAQLRDNTAIDYTQLGLRFKLHAWEVLFNLGAAQCRLGLWAEATRSLEEALSKGSEGARDHLCTALDQVQKQVHLQPRQGPRGEVFRPHRWHLELLEPVDFLGKAKVVSSAFPADRQEDIQPQQPQVQGADGRARPGAAPRAAVTGAWKTRTACGPRRPPETETQVGPGQAGQADHHAPVLYDEQGVAVGDPESLVTLIVQCAFTLALKVPRGADLSSLRTLLSQALPDQAQHGQLSYQDPSNEGRWVPLAREEVLQRAWRDKAASPGVLRLQCRGAGGRPVLYQVVARHSYSAQGPEDLDLQPGDIVDVLCEVDPAWLEGHCDGRIGIFPKCFVVPAGQYM